MSMLLQQQQQQLQWFLRRQMMLATSSNSTSCTQLTTSWAHLKVNTAGVPAKLQGTHPVFPTTSSGGLQADTPQYCCSREQQC